jgi:hypothetical protein
VTLVAVFLPRDSWKSRLYVTFHIATFWKLGILAAIWPSEAGNFSTLSRVLIPVLHTSRKFDSCVYYDRKQLKPGERGSLYWSGCSQRELELQLNDWGECLNLVGDFSAKID